MKAMLNYLFIIVLCISTFKLSAQIRNNSLSDTILLHDRKESDKKEYANNFLKINVASLIFKTYSLEYERVLNKKVSVLLTFKTMPESSLPFKNLLKEQFGEDDFTRNAIENFRLSSFSLSPQVRFYLSKKGYGRGFYIAPFYNYSKFSIKKLPSQFKIDSSVLINIDNSGKFSSNTGGILLGAQWMLSKRLSLDWSIAGPHYGSGKGNLIGISERDLTIQEQQELKETWENSSISGSIKSVSVSAKQSVIELDGPWGGLKVGLSLGLRF